MAIEKTTKETGNKKASVLGWFKPNKANTIGTVILLVANFIGTQISRPIMQLILSETGSGIARRGSFPSGGISGAAGQQVGSGMTGGTGITGILGSVIEIVILAILFYIGISIIMAVLTKKEEE